MQTVSNQITLQSQATTLSATYSTTGTIAYFYALQEQRNALSNRIKKGKVPTSVRRAFSEAQEALDELLLNTARSLSVTVWKSSFKLLDTRNGLEDQIKALDPSDDKCETLAAAFDIIQAEMDRTTLVWIGSIKQINR